MGTYAEILLSFSFKENADEKEISSLIKLIDENQELNGNFNREDETLFLSSCRVQNLEWQVDEVLDEILKKFKHIVYEVSGSIMVEGGVNYWFNGDE